MRFFVVVELAKGGELVGYISLKLDFLEALMRKISI